MSKSWADGQAERIGAEVKRLRGERTGQWLSKRTADLGHRVSRTTLSEMESGRRKYFTTAELVVLARALNTAPIALMYPDPVDGEVEMLPGVPMPEAFGLQWFSGLLDLPIEGPVQRNAVLDNEEEYRRNLKPVETARQIWKLKGEMTELMDVYREQKGQDRRAVMSEIARIQREIKKLKADDGR